LKGRIEIA
jgi:hypothetical protein